MRVNGSGQSDRSGVPALAVAGQLLLQLLDTFYCSCGMLLHLLLQLLELCMSPQATC